MQIPNIENKYVQTFCNGIANTNPKIISLEPLNGVPENECYVVVNEHVKKNGGKQIFGWAIWEWPNVLIEAEFHSIWESPEGKLIDITPKPIPFESILFVQDTNKKYTGQQVNNIRKPLNNSLTVKKYIETANNIYREMNKGALANFHGEMEPTPKLIKLYTKMSKLQSSLVKKYGEAI